MADTLETLMLLIGFTAVMIAAVLLMVNMARENTLKADRMMEAHNVRHARDIARFGTEADAIIQYILPKERNLWEKLTRRIGVWAWQCNFFDGDVRLCKFHVSISTSSYFYMQLKGWTETSDKELAQKALDYMKWEREIP